MTGIFEIVYTHTQAWHSPELDIRGFNNGSGYSCIDLAQDDRTFTFGDYAMAARDTEDGIPAYPGPAHYALYCSLAAGAGLALSAAIVILGYRKRWYIRYHYLLRKGGRLFAFTLYRQKSSLLKALQNFECGQ